MREEGRDVNLGFLRERDHISVLATGFQSVTLYWTPGQFFFTEIAGLRFLGLSGFQFFVFNEHRVSFFLQCYNFFWS